VTSELINKIAQAMTSEAMKPEAKLKPEAIKPEAKPTSETKLMEQKQSILDKEKIQSFLNVLSTKSFKTGKMTVVSKNFFFSEKL
jgi:hypothetical protein